MPRNGLLGELISQIISNSIIPSGPRRERRGVDVGWHFTYQRPSQPSGVSERISEDPCVDTPSDECCLRLASHVLDNVRAIRRNVGAHCGV